MQTHGMPTTRRNGQAGHVAILTRRYQLHHGCYDNRIIKSILLACLHVQTLLSTEKFIFNGRESRLELRFFLTALVKTVTYSGVVFMYYAFVNICKLCIYHTSLRLDPP